MTLPVLKRSKIVALLCCGVISACADVEDKRSDAALVVAKAPIQSSQETEVLDWLVAYRALAIAPLDEQRREYLAAQAVASNEPNDGNRLRLALALSLSGVPWQDDNRLINLLEGPPSIIKVQHSPIQQLGFLLYRQAKDRQRLREEQRRHETVLIDEQKQRLRDEQRRHEAELLVEQRRSEELQIKLDALRRIDQELKNRKQTQENPP